MADSFYKSFPFLFASRGIIARKVDDTGSVEEYLNLDNCEELAENALSQRLGSTVLNSAGTLGGAVYPLTGAVVSTAKLGGLAGAYWRYAVTSTGRLYRRTGLTPGVFSQIASSLSGNPVWMVSAAPSLITSQPTLFIADANGMLKDNGRGIAPSQLGVFQPQFPVSAQAQEPDEIILDQFVNSIYGTTGFSSFTPNNSMSFGFTAAAITAPGIQNVNLTSPPTPYPTPGENVSLTQNTVGTGSASSSISASLPSIALSTSDLVQCSATLQSSVVVTGTGGGGVKWYYSINGGTNWTQFASSSIAPFGPQLVNFTVSGLTNLNTLVFKVEATATLVSGGSVVINASFTPIAAMVVYVLNTPIFQYQSMVIDTGGNQETVLVLAVTPTGFIADFTKPHALGVAVIEYYAEGTIAASATAMMQYSFAGTPVASWPTTLQQSDYIGFQIYVDDPTQVQSIQIAFLLGDGSTFYKVVAQGPLQNLLTTASTSSTTATTAATDALLDESLGLYADTAGGIAQLNSGAGWTPFLLQLSDFAGSGNADFNSLVDNWSNITGYTVTIVANDNASPVTFQIASLVLVGGAGPDSFAGVGYDYLVTFYNDIDGTESNPSIPVTNVNPPNETNWVYPRRQPVLLTINTKTYGPAGQLQDTQITAARVYRRGGTLGDNYRRVDEFPINIAAGGIVTYLDTTSDADLQGADFVSFTNDVPVTSSLPTPVNNTVGAAINTTNQVVTVTLGTQISNLQKSISVRQQVEIGSPTAIENNFETVIVQSVILGGFLDLFVVGFTAFVQNTHAVGETVSATAVYGQPVTGMAWAFGQMWYWDDPNNPSYLYWSAPGQPQYVSSAAYVDVGSPDDAITAFVPYKGNGYVSTPKTGFQSVAPGSNANSSPTIYPTACKHGIVAPFGWFATEEAVMYQAVDGLRAFAGGASEYMTQDQEFIWQGIGSTPIVEANQALLSKTVAAFWNMLGFFSYIGVDGNRHRLIGHQVYKRWRNDDFDAQSMYLEVDTNQLIVGDSIGLVHIDRQPLGYDQGIVAGVLGQVAIPINLQTFYQNQGSPANQKQYQNLQIDCFTNGQNLTLTLLFNDGQSSLFLGTVNNAQRGKVNFPLNAGLGVQAYKVALQITGNVTAQVYVYQASIEALVLPMTRRSFDSYDLNCGGTDSKIARDVFFQYTASQPINVSVYYDDYAIPFTFTMPANSGIRNPFRQRLPAVSFRTIRLVGVSAGDFMFWQDSCLWIKFQCQGRGYEKALFVEP